MAAGPAGFPYCQRVRLALPVLKIRPCSWHCPGESCGQVGAAPQAVAPCRVAAVPGGRSWRKGTPGWRSRTQKGPSSVPVHPSGVNFPQFRGATRVTEGWERRWPVPGATSLPALFIVPARGREVIREERAALRFLLLDRLFPRSPDLSLGKLSASPPRRVFLCSPALGGAARGPRTPAQLY